jgi:serine/threonine protein kinase
MIGQQIGSFRIEGKLGAGAMGVVYRATHVKSGRPAAVKMITLEQASKSNAAERFEREVEILQQLRHPNIVRFLAVGRARGNSYFAMEFVDGQTLDEILSDRELLPWPEVLDLAIQTCEALQYAHEKGVVHRDLKPSNVMVTDDGRVKLTDFGIAKDLDATALTATGRTLGTAAYMAPEQIRGTPEVSHKTDLYSLGCMLYQTLTGQPPFRGSNPAVLMNAHLNEPPARVSEKSPQVPRALDDLVLKMMQKSPADRPWDAQVVASTLGELREKLERGEPIKMVFGPPYVAEGVTHSHRPTESGAAATGGSTVATEESPSSPSAPRALKTRKRKRKKKAAAGRRLASPTTLGLAAALVAGIALIVWLLWPLSAEQLYAKARPLIQSDDYTKWVEADQQYFAELDRRFPDHPYKAEVAEVRDKIALQLARRRAQVLDRLKNPRDDSEAEQLYVTTSAKADEAVHSNLHDVAVRAWLDLAAALPADDRAVRGWILLARERAAALQATIAAKVKSASDLLAEARVAEANGQAELAERLRRRVIAENGEYPYMTGLVAEARTALLASGVDPDAEGPASGTPPGA